MKLCGSHMYSYPLVQNQLWETLSTSPFFEKTETDEAEIWSFKPPTEQPPPPLMSSLSKLRDTLPGPRPQINGLQGLSETLSELTEYAASQVYRVPAYMSNYRYTASGLTSTLSPDEEEIRREIRSLKGLVLNRYASSPTPLPFTVSHS